MIRAFIIDYTIVAVILMIGLFALIKLVVISMYGLRDDPLQLYIDSLRIYNKQVIKNTFHSKLKKYYQFSNNINVMFYTLLGFVFLIYFTLLL